MIYAVIQEKGQQTEKLYLVNTLLSMLESRVISLQILKCHNGK